MLNDGKKNLCRFICVYIYIYIYIHISNILKCIQTSPSVQVFDYVPNGQASCTCYKCEYCIKMNPPASALQGHTAVEGESRSVITCHQSSVRWSASLLSLQIYCSAVSSLLSSSLCQQAVSSLLSVICFRPQIMSKYLKLLLDHIFLII